ncbi:23S rRNA (uracil(1939)-C(5))-methyltransferase RlmD [Brevibacillus invocatus]|uniref:23S rRNA (uracil(1939)-C(5))-methyltransferase RlmD n=1 Tax=Brevibacillus invocatus TaxID=173959 RepID=UPI00203AD5C6|nr:23S rRNA (uracil(1939)-C(5))-methyltransferase RlmD [Brevibacillus invocatus]MCM3080328.1 23S rRNA (uracil(1939)-C(5))-methyltransferase RlmD [Brevibacillus invocatus]MCM3430591.1 23S rRNA (uracil(1939)-C(5))-methyltransferase RlmD [Brevibacillus invocatus]
MKPYPKEQDASIRVGQQMTLTIKSLGINGEGIGYFKRKIVFVDKALPGEVVHAEVTEAREKYAIARLLRVVEKSSARVKPPCPVYEECGGCSLQHMDYQAQLASKREIVIESLRKYAKLDHPPVSPTIGMDNPWSYRNKAQFQVGRQDGKLVAGLYQTGSHKLVNLESCQVQHEATTQIVQAAKTIIEELGIPSYDERKRKGVIRTIVARVAFATGETQLTLVTATPDIPRVKELVLELRTRLPQLIGITQNVNPQKTSIVFGEKTVTLWGKPSIAEKLGDLSFDLSARAFFQLNPEQTEKLYDQVKLAAGLTGTELVLDLYCGTGTIGLWLAPFAREVRGIEMIPEAVEDARRNAERNGATNSSFHVGKAEVLMPKWAKQQGVRPDVVVVDPPRTGLDDALIRSLLEVLPKRIVYVSCNPSTLAKDVGKMLGKYELVSVQPVDMFPHTAHVEVTVRLERKDTAK